MADDALNLSNGVLDVLPRFRVHVRVLNAVRARIATVADGELLGSLSARSIEGDEECPPTLYADTLLPERVSGGGARRHIPVVKCENSLVPAALRGGALRWRRLNARAAAFEDAIVVGSAALLRGVVALASRAGTALSLVLTLEAPPFVMWASPAAPDGSESHSPLVADNSLALALAAGTPMRDGETLGLLAQADGRVVTPIRVIDSEAAANPAGAWALGDVRVARVAAALFIVRAASRRNARLLRRARTRRDRDRDRDRAAADATAARGIDFLLAHYSAKRGGPPTLHRCVVRIEQEPETYVASVRLEPQTGADADDVDTLFADFETTANIARNEPALLSDATAAPRDSLDRIVGQVDALRTALDAQDSVHNVSFRAGSVQTDAHAQSRTDSGANARAEMQRAVGARRISFGQSEGGLDIVGDTAESIIDFDRLPKALEIDFEAEDLGAPAGSGDAIGGTRGTEADVLGSAADAQNWQRIQMLARKYLSDDYVRNAS